MEKSIIHENKHKYKDILKMHTNAYNNLYGMEKKREINYYCC